MNPLALSSVRDFWTASGAHPARRRGQNFLVDANIARIITDAAALHPDDTVLEIGPGLGGLTELLARRAGRVVAVEMDRLLYAHLVDAYAGLPHLTLVHADMLKLDHGALIGDVAFKLVGNLPYASGTAMLVNIFRSPCRPELCVVTLQMEVAERLAAGPGDDAYGLLGLWRSLDYEAAIIKSVAPTCFWPVPEVVSGVVCLRRRATPLPGPRERRLFFELSKHVFGRRRKQLLSSLRDAPHPLRFPPGAWRAILADAGLDPRARPENIDIDAWRRLLAAVPLRAAPVRAG